MFNKPKLSAILIVAVVAFSAFALGTQFGRDLISAAADSMKPLLVTIVGNSNVTLSGTPNVNVVNNSTNPVPVKDVNNKPRHPVQFGAELGIQNGTNAIAQTFFTVPSGKQLVIEYISVEAVLPQGELPVFSIETTVANTTVSYALPFNLQFTFSDGFGDFLGSQQFHVYADPGTTVEVSYGRFNSPDGEAIFTASVSGYLVDVP